MNKRQRERERKKRSVQGGEEGRKEN